MMAERNIVRTNKQSSSSSGKDRFSNNNNLLLVEQQESDNEEQQLRNRQNDEFKALKECFADQLDDLRKYAKVSKNPKKRKRDKLWIPLDMSVKIDSRPEPIAGFDLHIKCTRKYPLVPPGIGFKNVRGIGRHLITKLHKELKQEAASDEYKGQGCIAWLIMRAQQFLEDHYHDLELNNKSLYEQMVEQKQNCDRKAELNRKRQDEMDKLERDRQVEEIRQKILRKRELYNESKKRRDSQSSTLENDQDESTYDYEGDLDGADSTTASLTTDDGDTSRLSELDELAEEADDETIITRSRRSTYIKSREIRASEDFGSSLDKNSLLGQSRVNLEYEVIEELGHGGFGTVYKVQNRVDSRLYALKKVKLNPDNETLNEKIMREVKLLSRLNHENVIRYYTTWIETEVKETHSKQTITTSTGDDSSTTLNSKLNQAESCLISQKDLSQESSDDETDDVYHTSYLINDKNVEKVDGGETTANYVVFETTSDNNDENDIVESMKKALGPNLSENGESSGDELESSSANLNTRIKINRWLYIQMELGQGTLREAIDQGLPKQKDRARRFFREILDGLCHIHRQGIIHRDLKPVNIFLDSMDRPKIGDFGLATTNLFIVTQSSGPGIPTATAIKPNRMSLERLRLLASPDQGGDSPGDSLNKSAGERLKYIQYNQTDNIGTPLYMSPELSATNEKTRISKVIYSHKVDVYSLGIIYFEMLYPFKTIHERIIILQDLRKKAITMPSDVENHLMREDIELIKLLLTHDVAQRPTSEKLLTSNLLPSVGMKERECQNVIKQVVQNRQARTHKHMLRLLFEQSDSYADDFVFDYGDTEFFNLNSSTTTTSSTSTKVDTQSLLKDFNTNTFVLDQVKMKLEQLLRSRGFVNFVTPTLIPKYSASKYYNKLQLEDVVMLMDKNSSILTLPYDLRLPFARTIARTNINYMNRFAIEKIYRQRQILGYHPDQLWECCVDIVTPPLPTGSSSSSSSSNQSSQLADAEILNLMGEVVKSLPVLVPLKPVIKINHLELTRSILLMLSISENLIDSLLECITDSMSVSLKQSPRYMNVAGQSTNTSVLNQTAQANSSLPPHVKEDLKKDLLASRILTNVTMIQSIINLLDVAGTKPLEVMKQIEHIFHSKNLKTTSQLEDIRQILKNLDETICYAQGLGLELPVKISAGFVLGTLKPITFYSGLICLLECKRHSKIKKMSQVTKNVILAVGGRYDKLLEKFSRNRSEVFDRIHSGDKISGSVRDNRAKVAIGVSFGVEKLSRFILEDYVDKVNNSDCSTTPTLQQLMVLNTNQSSAHATTSTIQATPAFPIRYWPLDIAICSLTYPRSKVYISIISNLIKQLRDKGLMCNEILPSEFPSFSLNSLMMHCLENKVPYMMTLKGQSNELTLEDDFLQEPPPPMKQISPSSSPTSPSPMKIFNCIATLYKFDKSTLKEIKRCDHLSMIEFLIKRFARRRPTMNLNMDSFVNKLRQTVSQVAYQVNTSVNTIIPGNPVHRDYELLKLRCTHGCPGFVWTVHDAIKRDSASIKASLKDAIGPNLISSSSSAAATSSSGHTQLPSNEAAINEKQLYSVFVFDKSQIDNLSSKTEKEATLDHIRKGVTKLTRLRHPSILTVHNPLEESRSSLAFVTEHVYGNLESILKEQRGKRGGGGGSNKPSTTRKDNNLVDLTQDLGPKDSDYQNDGCQLDEVQIKAGLLQICDGLKFLHNDAKMLHRNLCLDNIFVDSNNTWKIAGFDFSCQFSETNNASSLKSNAETTSNNNNNNNNNNNLQIIEFSPKYSNLPTFPSLKNVSTTLPSSIVPNWSCSAPEHSNQDQVTSLSDIFSLGIISCALLGSESEMVDLSYEYGLISDTYKRGIHFRELADKLPPSIKSSIMKYAAINVDSRPSLEDYQNLAIFNDPQVQAIRNLDQQLTWDRLRKIDFFNNLRDILPRLSHQVKVNRLAKALFNEVVNPDMMPHVLPSILIIAKDSTPTEFKLKIFPNLKAPFRILEPKSIPLMLLDNLVVLADRAKLCLADFQMTAFTLIQYLLKMDQQMQEKCLIVLPTAKRFIDDGSMNRIILPELFRLSRETSILTIRVKCIKCIENMVDSMERTTIVNQVLPNIIEITSKEKEVIMASVGVVKTIINNSSADLTRIILATKVLPFLIPLSIERELDLQQFSTIMALIRNVLDRVEREQRELLAKKNQTPLPKTGPLVLDNFKGSNYFQLE